MFDLWIFQAQNFGVNRTPSQNVVGIEYSSFKRFLPGPVRLVMGSLVMLLA
jgi:hypothetical protein